MYCLINEQECFIRYKDFIPDKTRTASLLNGFKNEPFRKFIDVIILKIDLVWAVKSSKKYIENGKRALSHIKTLIKHVFLMFYRHELLMSFWILKYSIIVRVRIRFRVRISVMVRTIFEFGIIIWNVSRFNGR